MRCTESYTLAYSNVTLTCGLNAYHADEEHYDEIEQVGWTKPQSGVAVNVMPVKPPALQQELVLAA